MDASIARKHPAVAALLWALPLVAVLLALGWRIQDEVGHAASHLVVGLPALLLLFSSPRWRQPAPGRSGSVARKLAVIGLGLLAGGQLLEAIGAFGFEGYARQYDWLATLHDISMVLGPPGLLLLLLGGILTAVVRMKQRGDAGVGRLAFVSLAAACAAMLFRFAVLGS
jgi:hypothetical protein